MLRRTLLILLLTSIGYSALPDSTNRLSFGVEHAPFSFTMVSHYRGPYYYNPVVHVSSSTRSLLGFRLSEHIQLIGSFEYSSSQSEYKNSYSRDYTGSTDRDEKTTWESEDNQKSFSLLALIQYNYLPTSTFDTTPFFGLGIGKTLSSTRSVQTRTPDESSGTVTSSTMDEYYSQLGSPLLAEVYIGAEHFFSDAISIQIKSSLHYSKVSAEGSETIIGLSNSWGKYRTDSAESSDLESISHKVTMGLNIHF